MRSDAYSKESEISREQTHFSSSTIIRFPKTAMLPPAEYYVTSDPIKINPQSATHSGR